MWLFCAIRTASHGAQQKMGVGEQSPRGSLEDNLEGAARPPTQWWEQHNSSDVVKATHSAGPRDQVPNLRVRPRVHFLHFFPAQSLCLHRSFMRPPMRGCNDCRPRSALLEIPTWQRERLERGLQKAKSQAVVPPVADQITPPKVSSQGQRRDLLPRRKQFT